MRIRIGTAGIMCPMGGQRACKRVVPCPGQSLDTHFASTPPTRPDGQVFSGLSITRIRGGDNYIRRNLVVESEWIRMLVSCLQRTGFFWLAATVMCREVQRCIFVSSRARFTKLSPQRTRIQDPITCRIQLRYKR